MKTTRYSEGRGLIPELLRHILTSNDPKSTAATLARETGLVDGRYGTREVEGFTPDMVETFYRDSGTIIEGVMLTMLDKIRNEGIISYSSGNGVIEIHIENRNRFRWACDGLMPNGTPNRKYVNMAREQLIAYLHGGIDGRYTDKEYRDAQHKLVDLLVGKHQT